MAQPEWDELDRRILECLREDASRTHKEIGQEVHLTGQAVGARIRKLEDLGILEGFTVKWSPEKVGLAVHALVTVFMNSGTRHAAFQSFAKEHPAVEEVHRVSGEGCYWMRVRTGTQEELADFLDELLPYGNYRVSQSIGRVK
ncbi:Lrp/AsnC family transcriptional regulator [Gorillibacterium sp. sgz5001074]|uniref:Lrp/AsnC family transcriptional regulator n=1 Tax=Gorillibacterium sp. sgz5001074 TaxID=3446695 RepID=UPI003F661CEC